KFVLLGYKQRHGVVGREKRASASPGRQSAETISQSHDAGWKINFVPLEATWITRSVPVFMVLLDDEGDFFRKIFYLAGGLHAQVRVLLDHKSFFRAQFSIHIVDLGWKGRHPQIVEETAQPDNLHHAVVHIRAGSRDKNGENRGRDGVANHVSLVT